MFFISLIYFFITFQELPESGKPEAPVMDVLTFLQRPVERIQTYQALLKVSVTGLKSRGTWASGYFAVFIVFVL